MFESQADNNARAYFFPEDITSFLFIINIQRNKKSKLIIKAVMALEQLMKLKKCKNDNTRLKIKPVVDSINP